MMETSSDWQRVCAADELAHAQCKELHFRVGDTDYDAFVVNWQGEFHAYLNSCPHTGISMNWAPDQFFDTEDQYLFCGLHGALFEPDSGLCVHGPCLGQSLTRLALRVDQGQIFIANR